MGIGIAADEVGKVTRFVDGGSVIVVVLTPCGSVGTRGCA